MTRSGAVDPPDRILALLRQHLAGVPYRLDWRVPLAPFVLDGAAYDELSTAAVRLQQLLVRAGFEAAADTGERIEGAAVLRPLFQPEAVEARYAACMARPDVVLTPDGPRFIEFNVSSTVGGFVRAHCLARVWRSAYGHRPDLTVTDPLVAYAGMLADACRDRSTRRVTLVSAPRPDLRRTYELQVAALCRQGLDARFATLPEFADVVARRDAAGVVVLNSGLRTWRRTGFDAAVVGAARDAGCLVLAPMTSLWITAKTTMARLSAGRPWLGPEDRAVVARYLPWTRRVADSTVSFDGAQGHLPTLLNRDRGRFVLKTAIGAGASEVVVGRHRTAREWADDVARARSDGGWVAQEYVESVALPARLLDVAAGTVEERQVRPVLGPFLFGGRPAGCYARFNVEDPDGIVGVDRGVLRNIVARQARGDPGGSHPGMGRDPRR
jgi:hypothetical protein